MTVLLSLLPALVLFGGAMLYLIPFTKFSRIRSWLPLTALALSSVLVVALARASTEPVTLFEPSAILPGLALAVQWNGAALPFGLFMLALTAARLLMGNTTDERAFVAGALLVNGAALLFFAADNFSSVAAAWLLVELALLWIPDSDDGTRKRAATAFAWNISALLLWLSAGMMLANQGISLRLQEAALSDLPMLLALLAIWIRSGLYPLHGAAPSNMAGAAIRVGAPMLLAGYLTTRALSVRAGSIAFANEMQILTLLALIVSAVLVVMQPHGAEAVLWALRAFGSALLLLFVSDVQGASALSVWLTLGAFALCVWVSIAWAWRAQLSRIPLASFVWIIALVMAAALPMTPAFWGRTGLLAWAYAQGVAWWLVVVIGAALYLIPLWREIFASRNVALREPTRVEYAAFGLALVIMLAVALAPNFFMAPFGPPALDDASRIFGRVFNPANLSISIFAIAGLAVPVLFAFEVARRWNRQASILPARLASWFDLSRPGSAIDFVYRFVRAVTYRGLALLEQPPIAWLIFLAIVVAVWIMARPE